MSSLFDSFFGFIFWGLAYFRMRKADGVVASAARRWLEGGLNIVRTMERGGQPCSCPCSRGSTRTDALCQLIVITGVFFLTCGTYASVEGIMESFRSGTVGSVFQCTNNGI